MQYHIKGLDTAGQVVLHRETVPAAIKKAAELLADGCWDVAIETLGGTVYRPNEFESLIERVATAPSAHLTS